MTYKLYQYLLIGIFSFIGLTILLTILYIGSQIYFTPSVLIHYHYYRLVLKKQVSTLEYSIANNKRKINDLNKNDRNQIYKIQLKIKKYKINADYYLKIFNFFELEGFNGINNKVSWINKFYWFFLKKIIKSNINNYVKYIKKFKLILKELTNNEKQRINNEFLKLNSLSFDIIWICFILNSFINIQLLKELMICFYKEGGINVNEVTSHVDSLVPFDESDTPIESKISNNISLLMNHEIPHYFHKNDSFGFLKIQEIDNFQVYDIPMPTSAHTSIDTNIDDENTKSIYMLRMNSIVEEWIYESFSVEEIEKKKLIGIKVILGYIIGNTEEIKPAENNNYNSSAINPFSNSYKDSLIYHVKKSPEYFKTYSQLQLKLSAIDDDVDNGE